MNMEKLKTMALKPIIHGSVTGVGLSVLAGDKTRFIYNGRSYPIWLIGGGIGAVSCLATTVVNDLVLPHIERNKTLLHLESMTLALAVSGGSGVLAAKMLNPNLSMNEAKLFAVAGIGGEVISSYIYSNFIHQDSFM